MYYFYHKQKTVSCMVFQSKVLAWCVVISFVSLIFLVLLLIPSSMKDYRFWIYKQICHNGYKFTNETPWEW